MQRGISMMKRRVLVALALSTVSVFAQGRGGGRPDGGADGNPPDAQTMIARRVEMLARFLTLTDDQKAKATTIFTEAHATGTSARTAAATTRQSLRDAVKSNDTAAIDRLAVQLGSTSGQLIAIDSKAEAAFYLLLTAEQKAKYDERGQRGGPGFFGGGGPGRGPLREAR
jgi:Spy/CpxP family protein refolding chaperone